MKTNKLAKKTWIVTALMAMMLFVSGSASADQLSRYFEDSEEDDNEIENEFMILGCTFFVGWDAHEVLNSGIDDEHAVVYFGTETDSDTRCLRFMA